MTPPRPVTAELLTLAVHEFRTPVSVVAGYLGMLSKGQLGPLTERQLGIVEETLRSCTTLTALIAEMEALAEFEEGTARVAHDDIDLVALVDEVVAQAAQATESRARGVTAARISDEPALVIRGDRKRLREVVASLVVAVMREQPERGEVTVRTGRHAGDGRAMAALTIGPADTARFVLTSDGPDARLNEGRGGLGLSLPVARRVIERLGGRIWSAAAERMLGAIVVIVPLKEKHS